MSVEFQPSLFDTAPTASGIGVGPLAGRVQRTELSRGAWVDVLPGWFEGADEVFEQLLDDVPWRAERRPMYDNVVDVPRLLHIYGVGEALPHPLLDRGPGGPDAHYARRARRAVRDRRAAATTATARTRVAWHGDNIGRGRAAGHDGRDRVVRLARASCSCARVGGHIEVSHALGHGDLIVMGGSCQRTWEHAIPRRPGRSGRGSACSSGRGTCSDRVRGLCRPALEVGLHRARGCSRCCGAGSRRTAGHRSRSCRRSRRPSPASSGAGRSTSR